jgi:hypothetical protein
MNSLIKVTGFICVLVLLFGHVIPSKSTKIFRPDNYENNDQIFLKQNVRDQKYGKFLITARKRNPYRYRHANGIKTILGKIRKYG